MPVYHRELHLSRLPRSTASTSTALQSGLKNINQTVSMLPSRESKFVQYFRKCKCGRLYWQPLLIQRFALRRGGENGENGNAKKKGPGHRELVHLWWQGECKAICLMTVSG